MSCLIWSTWSAKKAAAMAAEAVSGDETPVVTLDGDTLLSSLGINVSYKDCALVGADHPNVMAQIEKMRQNSPMSGALTGDIKPINAQFLTYIRSMSVYCFADATGFTYANGYYGYNATFALPFNGVTTPFYLEVLIPETGDIEASDILVTLSIVGGA